MVCLFPDGQNCIVWPFCFTAKHMKAWVSVDSSLIIEKITKRWLSRNSSAICNGSFSYFSWVSQMKLMSNNIIILISGGSHRASSVSLRKFQMAKINEWLAYQCCTDYSSGPNEYILLTHVNTSCANYFFRDRQPQMASSLVNIQYVRYNVIKHKIKLRIVKWNKIGAVYELNKL